MAGNAPAWSLTSRSYSRRTEGSMSSNDVRKAKPRVLLAYYSHTQQAKRGVRCDGRSAARARLRGHPGRDRVHGSALCEELQGVFLSARGPRHPPAALAAAAAEDGADSDSRRGEGGRLRPRLLRLAHVVLHDQHAAALVPEVGRGARRRTGPAIVVRPATRSPFGTGMAPGTPRAADDARRYRTDAEDAEATGAPRCARPAGGTRPG